MTTEEFKVFVSNVPFSFTTEDFVNTFKEINGYISATLILRAGTQYSRGFGYVTMASKESYDNLLKMDISFGEKHATIVPYQVQKKNYSIHVKYVPYDMTEEALIKIFQSFGNVVRSHININYQTGKPKGTAFIDFDDVESFKKVLNERIIKIDNIHTVEVSKKRKKIYDNVFKFNNKQKDPRSFIMSSNNSNPPRTFQRYNRYAKTAV